MNGTVLKEMLGRIAERGRAIVERRPARVTSASATPERIEDLCRALLSGRGEASGVALGGKVLDLYAALSIEQKVSFFRILARDFGPNQQRLRQAWAVYDRDGSPAGLRALLTAVEPPRQELFRRLNLAPGGTRALVAMREDLIKLGENDPALAGVEDDLVHLFYSWFNRGFFTPGSTAASL